MQRPKTTLLSLFLLALTVLMVEISLTRIFSVLSWHHFAYLVISLAMLGFGAAGSYLTVARRFADERIDQSRLGHFAWLFAVTLSGATIVVSKIRFYPVDIVLYHDYSNGLSLLILYAVMGVPFFFAGVCIGRMVALAGDRINLFYFVDLTGAGVGALLAVAVINYLGAVPGVFLGASFAALAACLLGSNEIRWRRWLYGLTLAGTITMMLLTEFTNALPYYYPPSKSMYRREHQIDYSRWHVVGKIDITSPSRSYWSFGGALSRRYQETPPLVRGIYQDGAAPTGIMLLEGPPEKAAILGEYLQGIAYVAQPAQRALIIGIGGGIDGLIALHYATPDVLGVDINPIVVNAVQRRFRDDCPSLWSSGRFKMKVSEGRHFLSRCEERFDVIQLSGVDTYTALSTGAYALSENFLYTKEAMHSYWGHLTNDGILSFSRWLFAPPRETLRLVTTQLEMLNDIGVQDHQYHFVIVSGPAYHKRSPWAEVLLKRAPFTKEQVNKLLSWADERQFEVVFDPYNKRPNTFDAFIRADQTVRKKLIADYQFRVEPTTDDDPFFFQFYRWKSLLELVSGKSGIVGSKGGYGLTRIPLGLIILAMSLLQMLILSFVFILTPLWMRQRLRTQRPGRLGIFLYFTALGVGFIFIEITLLQKFSVFVGGPVSSMAVTLASILVFSGLGSFLAQVFRRHPGYWLIGTIAVLVTLIGCEAWFFNQAMAQLMGLSLEMRWLVTVLAVAPLALLMGMPFPTGLRILQQLDESVRPWAWGINSCATVIGSILCVLLSIHIGFTGTIFTAAAIYIIGGFGMILAQPQFFY
jgi:hypothetical protein